MIQLRGLYNPATRIWSVTGAINTPRFFHAATLLANGRVLIAGGKIGNSNVALNTAEIYDPPPALGARLPTSTGRDSLIQQHY